MQTNLQKEAKFLSISAEQGDKVDISRVGNQSHKLMLPCGCSQVQHGLAGSAKNINSLTGEALNAETHSKRFQFFEFCDSHK